jgi:hypothetical protein
MEEDEIAEAYEDYLGKESDGLLLASLGIAMNIKRTKGNFGNKGVFEDYEREHLIRMIQNIDYTGKLNSGFEDARKKLVTNDGCG